MKSLLMILILAVSAQGAMAEEAQVTTLISKDLAAMPGKEILMIRVEYPPGHIDAIHRHNAQAFVYVLQGSVVMQVRGGRQVTLEAGQTFCEAPTDLHIVARIAGKTESAKLVVFLDKDKGAPVVIPAQ